MISVASYADLAFLNCVKSCLILTSTTPKLLALAHIRIWSEKGEKRIVTVIFEAISVLSTVKEKILAVLHFSPLLSRNQGLDLKWDGLFTSRPPAKIVLHCSQCFQFSQYQDLISTNWFHEKWFCFNFKTAKLSRGRVELNKFRLDFYPIFRTNFHLSNQSNCKS